MTLPFTFLYVYSLLRERERRYRRGEMEEAESRMCLSFQDTDHMSPPTAPRWPLFLRGISLCTCVCRGWHWLIGRKAKSFPPLCRHVVGFFPSHNTAVLTTRPYFFNFFFKKQTHTKPHTGRRTHTPANQQPKHHDTLRYTQRTYEASRPHAVQVWEEWLTAAEHGSLATWKVKASLRVPLVSLLCSKNHTQVQQNKQNSKDEYKYLTDVQQRRHN